MNCTSCGAGLGSEQAYCIACGQRATALGMPFAQVPRQPAHGPRRFSLPVPPQMATTLGALAIGFGFVIGNAISPGVRAISAATSPLVAAVPAPAPPAPAITAGGPGAGGVGQTVPPDSGGAVASTGETPTSGGEGGGGGGAGGHHKKKQKKPATAVTTLVGTVVHTNPVAGSYAVATGGALQAVHAGDLPMAGDQVQVIVHKLFNGTFAQDGARTAQGSRQEAIFSGTVTYRDDTALVYTVSARGSSVLVHVPAAGTGDIPPLAASVTATVSISPAAPPVAPTPPPAGGGLLGILAPPASACDADGTAQAATPPPATVSELTQTAVTVDAQHSDSADLEGIVQAVCPGELVVSADDVRESFSDLDLALAGGLDAGHLAPGQPISLTGAIAGDGKLTVTGFSSDRGAAGAGDPGSGQGTQK